MVDVQRAGMLPRRPTDSTTARAPSLASASTCTSREVVGEPEGLDARLELDAQLERLPDVPYRARYLRRINDYGRRMLDAERAWLDEVERELGR